MLRVICVNIGYKVKQDGSAYVKEGESYTVKNILTGYSDIAQREVVVYEFEELEGYFEIGMFIPLSTFNEKLKVLLRTKPLRKCKP